MEPDPVIEITPERLVDVAAAIGNAADLKSLHTQGHSGETARVAVEAAGHLGLESIDELRIVALLHDVGRVAVSDVVWEKRGPLNSSEWEEVRMHPYHAERVLTRSGHLAPLARAAGMHHERPNGSGYHRGCRSSEIPAIARLVGVASAWVAMQQPRAYRPAMEAEAAAAELRKEAGDGKLDVRAVDAVLAAAGRGPRKTPSRPAGLSTREIEVLRLLAAGCTNADIGERLHISRRTAEHHVQHIYTKIGVSTRPGAALFALEHDLLEPIGLRAEWAL